MAKETFKTMIGGQALIEGIMMRGPKKDAIVIRTKDGLDVDVKSRKLHPKDSAWNWPFLRGPVAFLDAQVTGVKALMHSADFVPEEEQESMSKFDRWLDEKMKDEKSKNMALGITVAISMLFVIGLLFILPGLVGALFENWVSSNLAINLIEGVARIVIFVTYVYLSSLLKDMKRVFSYHGAEHKTISCYEAGLPLTVENVKIQSRFHPRCGTSFLMVVVVLSILLFSLASGLLLKLIPALAALHGTIGYKFIMMAFKLLLLPLVVSIAYEINRWVGRCDNGFTKFLVAPGLWMQRITTNEPDDDMIQVAITAVEAVLPEEEGEDRW